MLARVPEESMWPSTMLLDGIHTSNARQAGVPQPLCQVSSEMITTTRVRIGSLRRVGLAWGAVKMVVAGGACYCTGSCPWP